MDPKKTFVIIGGGAAGIFAAITAAELDPQAHVIVLEKTRQLLAKVRISGGGRCNVTHSAFDPKLLVQHYPRGNKELLGPFHRFQPKDTIDWFLKRNVRLKTEEDGRMFPTTDSSETIASCLLAEARRLNVEIRLEQKIEKIQKKDEGFLITLEEEEPLSCDKLLIATGSFPQGHEFARAFGHTIVPPVPSLFTFNVPTSPLLDLSGIAVPDAIVRIQGTAWKQRGPVLITHWGFSGPAALKLSAWAARELHRHNYRVDLVVQWVPDRTTEEVEKILLEIKSSKPQRAIENEALFKLPLNLWKRLVRLAGIAEQNPLSRVSNAHLKQLAKLCTAHPFKVEGKTTYKQEFVTCGGVLLKEVDFKRMESRLVKNLFFSGEVLDIDGVTGGFNFQNAWTSGWIAGNAMSETQPTT
ncbi:MAG: NAD(P)/FAD-dependent oxidoreductase [Verrucomicrobia bacterium]|nr:NAD(P)/FAD-dependent oxidoreductase [Verrucomicrobiota bacterium]